MPFLAKVAVGILIGLIVIVIASSRWKSAGRSLLFILIFEGVFRKWLLPAASDFIYFFKDWVLIGTVIGMWQSDQPGIRINWRGLPWLFGLLAAMLWIQVFNPTMASPIAGVFGLKAWMLWTPFVFVVPKLFENVHEFSAYVVKQSYVFLGVAGLAMVQFRLPESHFLNQYVREQEGIASFGERGFVRVCATFPYLSGFTNYLAFLPVLFLPAAIYFRGRISNIMQFGVVPLLLAVGSMTGARATLYYMCLFIPMFFAVGVSAGGIKFDRLVRICLVAGTLTLGLLFTNGLFRDALTAMIERNATVTQGSDTALGRTFGGFEDALSESKFSWFGEGVGAASEAPRSIASLANMPIAPSGRYAETEPGRVMIETGLVGLVLWIGIKIYLIVLAFVMYRTRQSEFTRAVSLGVFLYLGILFAATPLFDHTLAPFYWFNVGLLFLMEKFDYASPNKPSALRPGNVNRRMVARVGPLELRDAK